MSFGSFLMLSMIGRINGERSLSGIIHMLRGRQSIQTIQDSMLFHTDALYHVYDTVSRERFAILAEDCRTKRWIMPKKPAADHYVLTESGEKALTKLSAVFSFPESLKYTGFVKSETDFWLSLQLIVQALSEHVHHSRSYLPVTGKPAVTETVRRMIFYSAGRIETLANAILNELSGLLADLPEPAADLLTSQFSGYQTAGLTTEQAGESVNQDVFFCKTIEKAALRQMMQSISGEPGRFPSLAALLPARRSRLSQSARVTYTQLQSGKSLDELVRLRHLSRGTIEDHIVEITLTEPDFNITGYLTPSLEKKITETARRIGTRQLKPIRTALGNRADYFQIRLALAKDAVCKEGPAHG
ncbi:helix-turn-helix domain-containing protein [Sporolactobacillus vineae]|uniref:helix-turn-helix domain-containing protein n=1 Tax=Sporolactobacillus vineae TaxID=444463 RepID=UPI000289BF11|nr:helix-turn-helix domain-containing protein [Sporolactobacillus vineae]